MQKNVTITKRVHAALQHDCARLKKKKPTDEEIDNLMWKGLRQHDPSFTDIECDKWLLDFTGIQMRVNLHDWLLCIPSFPSDSSTVKVNFQGKQKSPKNLLQKLSWPLKNTAKRLSNGKTRQQENGMRKKRKRIQPP
jgi:hypothetical protein